jgi:activator of HSP90 ATPase
MINTKNIEQTVTFVGASPHDIYEALLDAKQFAAWSGKKATISRKAGGDVLAFEGFIRAVNVELVPDKRIVQAWKGGIEEWPKDHYSIAVFALESTPKGTLLSFTQIGVPETAYAIVEPGWADAYWSRMKKVLEK